ncbi:MAG: hypothetical protein CMI55_01705 [Parcubacteria group bacterium]|jgi:surface antigen|nr:hypothetical protein [Parcubacteria group bacterium]|tara:strand:+ start:13414 stop:14499 length:1086 start_codon:yes stop_codon:yes gene_type:complete
MRAIKQHLEAIIQRFKTDIRRVNRKLLVAAVILFSLSWSLVGPVKGVEQIVFSGPDENLVLTEPTSAQPENSLASQNYLAANTLASLTAQPTPLETTSQNLISSPNEDSDLATIQDTALIVQTNPLTLISQEERYDVFTYVVQTGDTSSAVAASFGLKTNTLLWANDLKETSLIRPGNELTILPLNGLIHRVRDGDTIGAIATKYEANTEKIIAFNDLPADGAIQINEKLVIPDGQMPAPVQRVTRSTYVASSSNGSRVFPYGQCTWYIAQKRKVTWSGHAKAWLANARVAGYSTGSAPQVGAIMVMSEGGWVGRRYGHVAYVESIQGEWITISEMNYTCFACKSVRTIKISDRRIRGYIY